MKSRPLLSLVPLLAAAIVAGCGAPAPEPEPAPEPAAPMDPAAALDEMTEYYVTHFNMHHPSMVADVYTDDAVNLLADGSIEEGKEAIVAGLEETMAMSPTLSVDTSDRVITGDWAVSRGSYSMEAAPEGAEPMSWSGHWMSIAQRVDGDWKIRGLLTNFDADPPEGMPMEAMPDEAPPELAESPVADVRDYYQTHYNMGHGSMVATMFEDDAVVAFANSPLAEGREAIEARLNEKIEGGASNLAIHPVGVENLGEGWVVEGGWYEIDASQGRVNGNYIVLCRQQDDGAYRIHWSIVNGHSVAQ